MFDPLKLPIFILAALTLLLTPGPAVLYIVARSMDQGRLAGMVSVLSVEVGNFVHVVAVTLGLSALLLSSALAFTVIKYLGAAYLIYLGLRRIFSHETALSTTSIESQSLGRVFSQGVVVAVLNPKTALFFLAFLPQFVDPARGNLTLQLFTLGSIFVLMAIVTDSLYALLAGTVGQSLKNAPYFLKVERYLVGSVYVGLGLMAAFSDIGHI
ncbi:MAG: RhtB family transporter [Chloroflexi bacterium HGW-Chloroflexi-6]|nr:MAG: RhtB family transporter [Chloroflexi bacterium HGW-Chloroflexi-6]